MKPLIPLLILAALFAGLILFLRGDGESEPLRSPAPVGAPDPALQPGAADAAGLSAPSTAGSGEIREAAVAATSGGPSPAPVAEDARWIEGHVEFPEGYRADPTLEVFALTGDLSYSAMARALDTTHADVEPEEYEPYELEARHRDRTMLYHRAAVAADGSFRLPYPGAQRLGWVGLRGRHLHLDRAERVPVRGAGEPLVLRPKLGTWIRGRVHADGVPLPNELVRLGADAQRLNPAALQPGTESFNGKSWSADDGRYELRGVPAGPNYALSVRPDDWAAARLPAGPFEPGSDQELDIELVAGGSVRGIVLGSNGAPLADAEVKLFMSGFMGFGDVVLREAETDAAGRFVLAHVPYGKHSVGADHPAQLESRKESVEVREGSDPAELRLALETGKSVSGRVLKPSGLPAQGATVHASFDISQMAGPGAMNALRGTTAKTRSDDEGRFALTGLGGGPFTVRAWLDGTDEDPRRWTDRRDGVRPGTENLELVLQAGLALQGRVSDPEGRPVTNFSVAASRGVSGDLMTLRDLWRNGDFEDAEGRFTLLDMVPGTWQVEIQGDGVLTAEPVVVSLPSSNGEEPLEFSVVRSATVVGLVLDPDGQPLAGAQVFRDSGGPSWQRELDAEAFSASTLSGEDGSFTLSDLRPGPSGIRAESQGYAASDPLGLELGAGEVRESVELRLKRGGTIAGEILDDDGQPAAGRLITVNHAETMENHNTISDSGGQFRLEALAPGAWQVIALDTSADWSESVSSDGLDMAAMLDMMEMTQASVVDGEETWVTIGSPPANPIRVHGKVTQGGAPWHGAIISFYPEGTGIYERLKIGTVDDAGKYELELDGYGHYVVNVQRLPVGGGVMQQSTIEFAREIPSGRDEFELDFEVPLGRISGQVRGPDGRGVGGQRVTLTVDGTARSDSLFGGQYTEISSAADGTFDIQGLRPGRYRISAGGGLPLNLGASDDRLGRTSIDSIDLAADQWIDDVDIRLSEPGAIRVTVTDAQGDPVQGASMFVRDEAGRVLEPFSMIVSDGAGQATYPAVAPGRYTVTARGRGLTAAESQPVTVAAGEETKLALILEEGTLLLLKFLDAEGEPVKVSLSVQDDDGREVSTMISMADIQALYMEGDFSPNEHRIGPLAAGKYRVRAEANGQVAEKPVRLRGNEGEKSLTLRLR